VPNSDSKPCGQAQPQNTDPSGKIGKPDLVLTDNKSAGQYINTEQPQHRCQNQQQQKAKLRHSTQQMQML